MSLRLTTGLLPCGQTSAASRRSRCPVFFCALVFVWCAGWYCRETGQGLLFVASVLAMLAVSRPRALPGTARWVIWSGVFLTVVCLAANVERLVPPENAVDESRAIDRVITVAFALGLTALFFRSSINGVTLAAVGGLPMTMVILAREEGAPGAAGEYAAILLWGVVALLIVADLAQRLTRACPEEGCRPGTGEVRVRVLFLVAVTALAFGLHQPVERVAKYVQKQVFGWMMAVERSSRRRSEDLLLALPTPVGFGKLMRVVLLVEAERLPGYLRTSVFIRYHAGRWSVVKPELPLKAVGTASAEERETYALTPVVSQAVVPSVWWVEILSPTLLAGFCLPGNAATLRCEGPPPLADTNGTVSSTGLLPDRYRLTVVPGRLLESAYPWPDGGTDPAYLEVPGPLQGVVSNWVAACAGLSEAAALPVAIRRIEDHFATNFTYRLGLRMRSDPDPLMDFMSRKEGACMHFASAAALMFRWCGIPSRVVSGYVCSGWNPWLKRWVVREREGHAWVEVWDRMSGRWLVADPTPPDGNPANLNKPGRFRWTLDLLVAGWKRLLASLRSANFLAVIADAGETLVLFVWQVVWSLPGAVVLAGFGGVWWLRCRARRRALAPAERLRADLIRAMGRIERRAVPSGLRRRAFESWDVWLRRVGPELPPSRLDELLDRLERYQTLRYSVTLDEDVARAWLARTRNVNPHQRKS